MYRLYLVRLFFVCLIMVNILVAPVFSQTSSTSDKWGLGLSTNYNVPLFNFYDRFNGGPQLGLKWGYITNNLTYEIQYFYSKFSSGKIEDRKFQWVFDGNEYPSPDASSEIVFSGVVGNLRRPLKFNWAGFKPFLSINAGFIYYKHTIKNMVFPGQGKPPLDLTFKYSPDPENRTVLSIGFGGGLSYAVTPQINLALDVKYNILFGYLRPMEAWLLEDVSPLQLFTIGVDLNYYFVK